MKIRRWLAWAVLVTSMVGCSEKTPSDKLTEQVVRPYAEQDLINGMEIADFKRANGWVDSNSPNLYIVKYTLNYRLTKPVGVAVLELAQELVKGLDEADRKGNAAMFNGGLEAMTLKLGVYQRMAQEGEASVAARRAKLWRDCQACLDFWNSENGGPKPTENRRIAFLASLYLFENLGFTVDSKLGDKVPRWAQASFVKTENGWQAAQ